MSAAQSTLTPAAISEELAYEIGMEAYYYFYPLITMEITRRQCTNHEAGKQPGFGPMNLFSHMRAYPPADFKGVVRPNFDTLYSIAWLDLTKEPMIVSVPDTQGRYYLLPMLDMFSDIFASPGWRTSGTGAHHYAIVPHQWSGKLPEGVEPIDAPTAYVWIIGRTKTDGPEDYPAVHKIQDGFLVTPLSQWGKTPTAPKFEFDSTVDMETPPLDQINAMTAADYFAYGTELLALHQPHVTDWSITERMSRIGIEAGKEFDYDKLDGKIQKALDKACADALKLMVAKKASLGTLVNGWSLNTETMGVYGNFYFKRAIVAMVGLGANQPEDAVYPMNFADADGKPLHGQNNYVLHMNKEDLPPVNAFWSVTMYDDAGFQMANSLNRFAISSWMPLKKNSDGSIDLYLQQTSPGADKESNWLPSGNCTLGVTMRLYAPKAEVLNGNWKPAAIKKV